MKKALAIVGLGIGLSALLITVLTSPKPIRAAQEEKTVGGPSGDEREIAGNEIIFMRPPAQNSQSSAAPLPERDFSTLAADQEISGRTGLSERTEIPKETGVTSSILTERPTIIPLQGRALNGPALERLQ